MGAPDTMAVLTMGADMHRLRTLVCVVVGLAFAAGADAQQAQLGSRTGQLETRLGVLFNNSGDVDFNGGSSANVHSSTGIKFGLGYHVTENLELGGNITYDERDYEATIVGSVPGELWHARGQLDNSSMMLDATWNFLRGPLTPFVVGGIGWSWTDTNIANGPPTYGCWWDPWWGYVCAAYQNTKTLDGFAYQAGAGLRYDVNRQFSLAARYMETWIDLGDTKSTPHFGAFDLSLLWRF